MTPSDRFKIRAPASTAYKIPAVRPAESPEPVLPSTRTGRIETIGAPPTIPAPSAAAAAIEATAVPWPSESAVSDDDGWPASSTKLRPGSRRGSSEVGETPLSITAIVTLVPSETLQDAGMFITGKAQDELKYWSVGWAGVEDWKGVTTSGLVHDTAISEPVSDRSDRDCSACALECAATGTRERLPPRSIVAYAACEWSLSHSIEVAWAGDSPDDSLTWLNAAAEVASSAADKSIRRNRIATPCWLTRPCARRRRPETRAL